MDRRYFFAATVVSFSFCLNIYLIAEVRVRVPYLANRIETVTGKCVDALEECHLSLAACSREKRVFGR